MADNPEGANENIIRNIKESEKSMRQMVIYDKMSCMQEKHSCAFDIYSELNGIQWEQATDEQKKFFMEASVNCIADFESLVASLWLEIRVREGKKQKKRDTDFDDKLRKQFKWKGAPSDSKCILM